ncbi:uncharacterized protein KGF55_003015 [Candida pseudojiufengensis]|uniref:uncharacterized protein n=1 Tax=Candida pseudojiufengensis TaxID=497109 RepID=UPI0022245A4F|nr:uncharacterized protein KGF55_003015 [Candida pseudojiufengensis]KAI5963223.1 hypothetical protein KGF55_003015 [Candida pseudojiufengensis]
MFAGSLVVVTTKSTSSPNNNSLYATLDSNGNPTSTTSGSSTQQNLAAAALNTQTNQSGISVDKYIDSDPNVQAHDHTQLPSNYIQSHQNCFRQ